MDTHPLLVTLIEIQTMNYWATIWVSLVVVLIKVAAVDFQANLSEKHYLMEAVAADFLMEDWKNFHWNYSVLQLRLPAVNKEANK